MVASHRYHYLFFDSIFDFLESDVYGADQNDRVLTTINDILCNVLVHPKSIVNGFHSYEFITPKVNYTISKDVYCVLHFDMAGSTFYFPDWEMYFQIVEKIHIHRWFRKIIHIYDFGYLEDDEFHNVTQKLHGVKIEGNIPPNHSITKKGQGAEIKPFTLEELEAFEEMLRNTFDKDNMSAICK